MDFNDIIKKSFLYPVGSVDSTFDNSSDEFNELANRAFDGKDFGHAGVFHKGNPYYIQLLSANNQQDKDALYELAVKWEAQQADYAQQLGVNYSIMQEQREYDSPSSVIARQRAAGINPDIVSGSPNNSSSGSASLNTPQLSQIEGSTKFSNNYDNQLVSSQLLSSITSLFGGISSIGSSVVGAIDTLNTLSGRVALGEAQGQLAQNQADLIKQQTPAFVSTAQSQSSSAFTDAAMKNLSLYGSMAQMFTSDTTDDEITSLLSTLGYGDDIIPRHLTNFRNFQKNPALQKLYTDNKLASKISAETAANYPIELAARVSQMQVQLDFDSKEFESAKIALQKRMTEAISGSSVIEDSVGVLSSQQMEQKSQSEFNIKRLEHDTNAFIRLIEEQARYIDYSERIEEGIRSRQGTYDSDYATTRTLTPDEQAIIDAERIRRLYVKSLASSNLQQLFNLYKATSRNLYNSRTYMRNGAIIPEYTSDTRHHFEEVTFDDFVTAHRSGDSNFGVSLTKKLLSSIPIVGDIVSFIP